MKHKKKRFVSAVLCFILMINGVTATVHTAKAEKKENKSKQEKAADWPEGPKITASSAVVMDAETGLVLYEKNATEKYYPASITKILTTLLAIENCPMTDKVLFSKDSRSMTEGSLVGIDWGEEVSLEDCLYGIMLMSGNECAYAVAEHVGGTYDHFIQMMNDKAKELGCVNSHFANSHGLFDEEHYTCAYDMALISRTAIRNSEFAKITGASRHKIPPTNKQKEERYLYNKHGFINHKYTYEGCIGGKTGYTAKARHTLATFAKRGDMTLVCIIMDENDAKAQYTETKALLDYGFENFSIYHLNETYGNELPEDNNFFNRYDTVLNPEKPLLSMSDDAYVILPAGVKLSAAEKTIQYYSEEEMKDQQKTNASSEDGENEEDVIDIGTVTYTYHSKEIGKGTIRLNLGDSILPVKINDALSVDKHNSVEEEFGQSLVEKKKETKERKDLKPLILVGIAGVIVILILLYYFFVVLPRRRRKRRYLERRNHYRTRW